MNMAAACGVPDPSKSGSNALMNPEIHISGGICGNPHSSCAKKDLGGNFDDVVFLIRNITFWNSALKLTENVSYSFSSHCILFFSGT